MVTEEDLIRFTNSECTVCVSCPFECAHYDMGYLH